jgi:RND family efflux transporter MFP subunit
MNRWIGILAAAAVLTAGGNFFWKQWKARVRDNSGFTRAVTVAVEHKDIQFNINAAGDIGPADQVSVRPEVNGKIATLLVDIGDVVKKGAVLFTLDDTDLQTERSSQMTLIDGAKLQLAKAQRNYERSLRLFNESLIAKGVFDDTKTDFDMAKNALEIAQKSLSTLDAQLLKTKILAPFDCTVLTRPVSMGQAVSGSSGFNSGTEVLTIANLNDMVVSAHVNQADVTRVKNGQDVDIQVESVPGLHIKGKVERVAPQATIKNNIKGFDARIALTQLDPRVRPGMTANLQIPVASASQVLAIPLAAVFTETLTGEHYAYVKEDGYFERRTIRLGVSDYSLAEITSGLSSNEVVCMEQPAEEFLKPAAAKSVITSSAGGRTLASLGGTNTNLLAQAGTNTARANH